MPSILIGMLGAILIIASFVAGLLIGFNFSLPSKNDRVLTEDEIKKNEEAEKRFREEQDAFTSIMSYNANTAYGIESSALSNKD